MYRQAHAPYFTRTVTGAIATALQTNPAAAILPALTVRLYKAATTPPSQNSAAADFTECAFVGYAAVAGVVFSAVVNLDSGLGRGLGASVGYIAGGGIVAPGENALGYFITDAAGTTVYVAEQFQTPVPFVIGGDFLDLDVMLPVGWNTDAT